MKMVNAIACFREDLKDAYIDVEFSKIEWSMFSMYGTGVILHEDMIVFIDTNGSSKILKNRLGDSKNP